MEDKIFIRFFCLLFTLPFFSQTDFSTALERKLIDVCEKGEKNICIAFNLYKEKKYDSCYLFIEENIEEIKGSFERDALYYMQGKVSISKKMHLKALKCFSLISNDVFFKSIKKFQIGNRYLALKKYDKALSHFLEWEKDTLYLHNKDKYDGFHNIAINYLHLKKFDVAKEYFNKEFSLIKKHDTLELISFKTDLANVYYNQYLDDEAIPLFKEAYDLSKVFSDLELKQNTAKNMAVVEKNRKRFKESVDYYIEYGKWKDSIWNRDKIWQLTEKDKKIAVAQKQQEITIQDEQIKRQKIVQKGLLFGASGLLVFLGGLAFFYKKLQGKNKLITEQKEALNTANKTKDYLFSVVSHDLRSPINTIKKQHQKLAKHIANNDLEAIKETTSSAIAVTESTSHLLNNVLHWSLEQSNMLNFSQEEHALFPIIDQVLFDYEDLAEAKDVVINSDLNRNLIVKIDKESLKIVLRNLIDNSIKYMNGSGSISVKTTEYSENKARIEIKDSGIGISEEKLQRLNALKDLSIDKIDRSKGVGLGLLLCQTLVKKNNGTLFFESEEGVSTTAIILLPLA